MEEENNIPSVEDRVINGLTSFRDALANQEDISTTTLTGRDAERFIEIIESDAEPNQKLTEAAKRYKDAIENGKLIVVDRKLP